MYDSILVPVDLNQESSWKKVLPVAIDLAQKDGGELHILTVIPDFGMAVVGSFFPPDHAKNAMEAAQKDLAAFVAYSGVIRPPIPIVSGHPYRFNPAGDSGVSGHPVFA